MEFKEDKSNEKDLPLNNNKSLSKWFLGFIVGGAAVMCLSMIIISMMLYMRSVRRIYKKEMLTAAEAVIELTVNENLKKLCKDSLLGEEDKEAQELADNVLEEACISENLTGIALYDFDESSMTGKLIISADNYGATYEKNISFSKKELHRLLNNSAALKRKRGKADKAFNNIAYKDIRDDDGKLVGLMQVSMTIMETLEARIRLLTFYTPLFVVLITILALLAYRNIKSRVIAPLVELNSAAKAFGAKDSGISGENKETFFKPPHNMAEDEIGTLWKTCSAMEQSLNSYINDLKTLTAEKERQQAEVTIASQIQSGMLPGMTGEVFERKEFSILGSMTAAKGVGGDFYDYFMIDDDHLAMVIGDVSGKGIPASLFMVLAMTQIRLHSKGCFYPSKILENSNNAICEKNPEMMFVTVWMGVFEISTRILRECNAGHEYPAIKKAGGLYEIDMSDHDMALGIMENMTYTEKERRLSNGDRIFIYSDGLPEATDLSDEQFGIDRMITALNNNRDDEEKILLKSVEEAVSEYIRTAPQFDDLTMLSFTVN